MAPLKSLRGLFLCVGVCGVVVSLGTVVTAGESEADLYRVLGVSRSASQREIKNAYKRQAKLWHPDKNKSPEAMDKLIEINGAYEVLSDADKRRSYDITGRVGDSPQPSGHPRGRGFTYFQGGFRFQFPSGPTHRNDDISSQQFFDDILVNSHHKPYLLNFYTDFCMQCANVDVIWKALRKDLSSLGVGLGSVHAHMHPRVTQYCGVSHVPSIVGVVSGRVVRFYGQLRDKSTMLGFLEDILPNGIITTISETNTDSFLSNAIIRNRARVLLFSPREVPSLSYKLTAFTHQKSIDFGFVSTHPRWENGKVLRRFGVFSGEKQLTVFKETYHPVSVMKGALNQAILQSSVEGLSLFLPRLSSPAIFDTVCPVSIRFCVILVVDGPSAYNDSVTAAFRKMAIETTSSPDRFTYIDSARQSEFLAAFQPIPFPVKTCLSGVKARPVLMLRRTSNLFDWFNQFCDEDGDIDALLSSLRAKNRQTKRVLLWSPLNDEEAPSWFGRLWNKVVQFFSDLLDFFYALDSNIYSPIMSLVFAALMICMLGLLMGTSEQDSKSETIKSDSYKGHHTTTTHRNGCSRTPPSSHSDSHPLQLYSIDESTYRTFVQDSSRSQIALVILIDTHHEDKARALVQMFCRVAGCYKERRLKLCYLCYRTHKKWFGDLLSQCDNIKPSEVKVRSSACLSGRMCTVVALLGSKKQFCVFPEILPNDIDTEIMPNGTHSHKEDGTDTQPRGPALGTQTAATQLNRNEYNTNAEHSSTLTETQNHSSSLTVGDVLGSMLGFDSDESERVETMPPNHAPHSTLNGTGITGRKPDYQAVEKMFETWLEKFSDGTLKRYRVDSWPKWRTGEHRSA